MDSKTYTNNEFVKITKSLIKIDDENKNLISNRDFMYNRTDYKHCVLIMRLNPAGNETDAKFDKYFHLRYIPENKISEIKHLNKIKNINKYSYSKYYKPIYEIVKTVYDTISIKWDWCNDGFEKVINENPDFNRDLEDVKLNEALRNYKEKIIEYNNESKNNDVVILLGELFYYHETNSSKLEQLYIQNEDFYNNIKCMFNKHLDSVKGNIDFVYINNGKASKLLYKSLTGEDDFATTYYMYKYNGKDVPVFFGGMLSNGVTDIFSKLRLINEIRTVVLNEQ